MGGPPGASEERRMEAFGFCGATKGQAGGMFFLICFSSSLLPLGSAGQSEL